jgi:cytoskeletal protein RodZ
MKSELLFAVGAAAMIVAAFFFGRGCNSRKLDKTTVDSTFTSDTTVELRVGDFFWQPKSPDTVYRDTGSLEKVTDTAYIVLDYFRTRTYSRSFSDSLVDIQTDITLTNNKLQEFELDYEVNRTTVTNTSTITRTQKPPEWSAWAGVSTNFQGFAPNVAYRRDGQQFEVGYDIVQQRPYLGYKVRILQAAN